MQTIAYSFLAAVPLLASLLAKPAAASLVGRLQEGETRSYIVPLEAQEYIFWVEGMGEPSFVLEEVNGRGIVVSRPNEANEDIKHNASFALPRPIAFRLTVTMNTCDVSECVFQLVGLRAAGEDWDMIDLRDIATDVE